MEAVTASGSGDLENNLSWTFHNKGTGFDLNSGVDGHHGDRTRCIKRRRVFGSLARGIGIVSAAGCCTLTTTAAVSHLGGPHSGTLWSSYPFTTHSQATATKNHGSSRHLRGNRDLVNSTDLTSLTFRQLEVEAPLQAAVGDWSPCTPECTRTRQVVCATLDFKIVPDDRCGDELPASSGHCETDACAASAGTDTAAADESQKDGGHGATSPTHPRISGPTPSDKSPSDSNGHSHQYFKNGQHPWSPSASADTFDTRGAKRGQRGYQTTASNIGDTSKNDGKRQEDATDGGGGVTSQRGESMTVTAKTEHDADAKSGDGVDPGAAERAAAAKSATDAYVGLIASDVQQEEGSKSVRDTARHAGGHGGWEEEERESRHSGGGDDGGRREESSNGQGEGGVVYGRQGDAGLSKQDQLQDRSNTSPSLVARGQSQPQDIERIGGGPGSAEQQRRSAWTVVAIGTAAVGSFLAVVAFAFLQYRKEQHRLQGIMALKEFPLDNYINPFCVMELTDEDRSAFKL